MNQRSTARRSRARRALLLAAMLAGGFLPMTCTSIIRDSFVSATKLGFASLLSPCNFQFLVDAGQCRGQ
jgi:hypothetical protein